MLGEGGKSKGNVSIYTRVITRYFGHGVILLTKCSLLGHRLCFLLRFFLNHRDLKEGGRSRLITIYGSNESRKNGRVDMDVKIFHEIVEVSLLRSGSFYG